MKVLKKVTQLIEHSTVGYKPTLPTSKHKKSNKFCISQKTTSNFEVLLDKIKCSKLINAPSGTNRNIYV